MPTIQWTGACRASRSAFTTMRTGQTAQVPQMRSSPRPSPSQGSLGWLAMWGPVETKRLDVRNGVLQEHQGKAWLHHCDFQQQELRQGEDKHCRTSSADNQEPLDDVDRSVGGGDALSFAQWSCDAVLGCSSFFMVVQQVSSAFVNKGDSFSTCPWKAIQWESGVFWTERVWT